MDDCTSCLKKFQMAKIFFSEIPFPGEILAAPPPGIMKFYNEMRNAWDSYVTALACAVLDHDQSARNTGTWHTEETKQMSLKVKSLRDRGMSYKEIAKHLNFKSEGNINRFVNIAKKIGSENVEEK